MKVSIRSRHPSHNALRRSIDVPVSVVYRLGSTTILNRKYDLEINSIEAIKTSSNKRAMKEAFQDAKVNCLPWSENPLEEFPQVAKHINGSRGRGNYKLDNQEELDLFLQKREKDLDNFIFEKYTSYCREYRLHISELGCFYACRKLRKTDIDDKDRWKFNNETCVWFLEENPKFDKPETWDKIVEDCNKARKAVGLDIAALDVRVSKKGAWYILETNSAPSLKEVGLAKYKEHLPLLIKNKI